MHYDDGFTFCKHVKESTQRCLKDTKMNRYQKIWYWEKQMLNAKNMEISDLQQASKWPYKISYSCRCCFCCLIHPRSVVMNEELLSNRNNTQKFSFEGMCETWKWACVKLEWDIMLWKHFLHVNKIQNKTVLNKM